MNRAPILAFSHVPWNSAVQRPHHIMSRLSRYRDVLFIEEPIPHRGDTEIDVIRVLPRLSVVQTRLSGEGRGFGSAGAHVLVPVLRKALDERGWSRFTAWLCTPMAVGIARALGPKAVVYDCMEELSAFRFAPAELRERERELFECADVVFTGGPSLQRAKRDLHPSVHCFPSSVDMAHFAGANGIPEALEQVEIPHPRLGFFGVIDERIDLEIIRVLASERPDWQIILVGPVSKIDEMRLPRAANIHYMGQRSYQDLPSFLAGWDACLMPFVMNASTRHQSPARCLEYMAADRPVVSTPVPDVAESYGDIVHLGRGALGFLDACHRALHEPNSARSIRRALASRVLRETSWEETVARMDRVLGWLGAWPASRSSDEAVSASRYAS